ncbi:MAG: DUF2892 domain-containing protein [Bacteroidota bacterium]
MPEVINVGHADGVVRIILGVVCLALVAYHFLGDSFLSIYTLIPLILLIPYFLKTGITRACPIMKAMDVSTVKKETQA